MKEKRIEKVAGKFSFELPEEESEVRFHKNQIDDLKISQIYRDYIKTIGRL